MTTWSNRIWRGPDGRHWVGEEYFRFEEEAREWVERLVPAVQDQPTGQLTASDQGTAVEIHGLPEQAGYTKVSANPLSEPRIARLHTLVHYC